MIYCNAVGAYLEQGSDAVWNEVVPIVGMRS